MQFDQQVQSITQDEIVPKIVDQTLESNVMNLLVLSKSRPWAGETMKFPVKMRNHTQGGSFSDFDEFKTKGENVREMAEFNARAYYQSVVIGGIARSVNGISKTQLLNLVKVEMESAHQDMVNDIGDIGYGTGTGNSNKDFLGTGAAVDTGGSVDTYGGLSRTTFDEWKAGASTSIGAYTFGKHRLLRDKSTVGGHKPTISLVDPTVFGYVESDYQASVEGNYNAVESNRGMLTRGGVSDVPAMRAGLTGQAGFDVLYFGGTPIVKDDKMDAQTLLELNLPFYRFYGVRAAEASPVDLKALYHEGNDYDEGVPSSLGFSWTGFTKPHNQYAWIGQVMLIGQYITPAPRLHARGSGITS